MQGHVGDVLAHEVEDHVALGSADPRNMVDELLRVQQGPLARLRVGAHQRMLHRAVVTLDGLADRLGMLAGRR